MSEGNTMLNTVLPSAYHTRKGYEALGKDQSLDFKRIYKIMRERQIV
jgi:hypothetical protein